MAKRWYIVHAYSNFEKKVADAIKEQAAAQGLDELVRGGASCRPKRLSRSGAAAR